MTMVPDSALSNRTVRFDLIGARDYVQGIEILRHMAMAVGDDTACRQILVTSCKFTRKGPFSGQVAVCRPDTPVPGAGAVVRCKAGSEARVAAFYPDSDTPIETRSPDHVYDIPALTADGAFGGAGRIAWRDAQTYLLAVVETNKRCVAAGAIGQGISAPVADLVALETLSVDLDLGPGEADIRIDNVMHRTGGGKIYVANDFTIDASAGWRWTLRFNFSVEEGS